MTLPTPNTNIIALLWLGGLCFVVMPVVIWHGDRPWMWTGVCGLMLLMVCATSRYVRRLNQQRMDAFKQEIDILQAVQTNKEELLAVVSHELRTPMNVVLGLHPRIREGLHQDKAALVLLDQLHAATESLLQVFNVILDTSQHHVRGRSATELTPQTTPRQPVAFEDTAHAITQGVWRMLVVDDNPVNLLVVRLMLQKLFPRAQVEVVNSASAAIAYLDKTQPDVMLVDVLMPGMDGYALTRWVRQHPRATLAQMPVVALTGQMRAEDAEQRTQSGINDVIYKPIDERQLCMRLSQLLEANQDEDRK